jgi:type I restriction enzyme M protein
VLIDTINNIDTIATQSEKTAEDLVGRVYEYILGKFAASEGKSGGEFYIMSSSFFINGCHLHKAA